MSGAPPEIDAAMAAINEAIMALLWCSYIVGNYAGIAEPRKRHHDGVRDGGANAVAATRHVVATLEGVVKLGRQVEKEQGAGGKLHVVGGES